MRLTDAEWVVMNVLWERAPATARDILRHLPRGTAWAYTTVKTLLTRLQDKGAVTSVKAGRSDLYSPALPRSEARRNALSEVLSKAFQGGVRSLMHCLVETQELTEDQKRELLDLLGESGEEEQEP